MALVVENGTGLSAAESYCSVAVADARHLALGNTAWAALTTGQKETALRVATDYLSRYRAKWIGTRYRRDQALDWPRVDVWVDGFEQALIVPVPVRNATADLALKSRTDTLAPDLERAVVREKVGPIETEFDRYSPQSKRFAAVEALLAPFVKGSSAVAMLVRA